MNPARIWNRTALGQARRPSRAAIVAGLFVIAIGLRALDVWRPVDGSIWNSWREANTSAIARNFDREGMNILYPRIDWRGDGPGYVATGLPVHSYVGAVLYRVFGYHEQYLRLVSLTAAVLGCYCFWRLADRVLPRWPAAIAFGFFASSPLLVASASWIQPESLMLLVYVAAVDQFDRWTDSGGWQHFVSTWLATTLAILIMLPAAHLAVLYALIALRKFGRRAAWRFDLWALALLCALPAFWWYAHAQSLRREYGHSLCTFNWAWVVPLSLGRVRAILEAVLGLLANEAVHVWTPTGLLIAIPAVRCVLRSGVPLITGWSVALLVFYLSTLGVTGAPSGYYYHILSVPVVALAVGMSSQLLFDAIDARPWDLRVSRGVMRQMWLAMAAIAAAYALLGGAIHYLVGQSTGLLAAASAVGAAGGLLLVYLGRWARGRSPRARTRRFRLWLVGLLTIGSLTAGWNVAAIRRYFQGRQEMFAKYEAALQFDPRLRHKGPIAIAGAARRDAYGRPMEGSGAYFFYWLDRKGFAVGVEELTIEKLVELSRRGVRFFIAEREVWDHAPVLEGIVRRRFRVVEDHPLAALFDLIPPEAAAETEGPDSRLQE